jgi:transcriptional regulator of acetoin/glycerol metabolism
MHQLPAVGSHAVPPDDAHLELIVRSHERCAALGLSRVGAPDHAGLPRADLAVARERNRRLHQHAAPVMELLLEQILASRSMVVLTDATGTVLHSIGDHDFLRRASRVALAPGANWSECSKGTNAIGTTLVDEAPTVVHADEHFVRANGFLTCSAAPIFDPRGHMLGVLDVSGDQHSYHQHTIGLVKMSARMIENQWLNDDFRHALRLHFHIRPEFIGTLMEGILAVGHDGRFLGCNRSALDLLGMSGPALRMYSVPSLLGTTLAALVDQFRSPMAGPVPLTLADGRTVHAQARLNWPTWHAVGPAQADDELHAPAEPMAPERPMPTLSPAITPALSGLRYLDTGDAQMQAVIRKVRRVVDRDIPVLVLGETGTGKELLARAIHRDSQRARQPFVAVNCAAIPENLIESELFGYEEGAFTGARRKGASGRIVQAHGGTLFLDEIGDMPLALQARLLRVLQERQVTPLGSARSVAVDVMVIAATHRNLRAMMRAQAFREDLYYRLNGLVVRLPALRERSDLDAIVQKILRTECGHGAPALHEDVLQLFSAYAWPGNIRQLAGVLRTAAVMAEGEPLITREHLSDDFVEDAQGGPALPPSHAEARDRPAATTLHDVEIQTLQRAVQEAGGNISVASRRLGISRNTIYRKLRWRAGAGG